MSKTVKKSRFSLFVLILGILVLFSACSSENNSQEATGTNDSEKETQNQSNSVTVAINGDIQDFNPYTNQSVDYFMIRFNVFDFLVNFDEEMNIVEGLAKSWTQDSDTQYTFTLQENVKFHNGETLTGEDVKYSIETVQSDETASFFAPYFSDVTAVEVSGNNVVVKLDKPNPAFLSNLASFPIIQKDSLNEMTNEPIGSGPFKFVSWSAGDKIELEKNDDYWRGDTTNIDKLTFRPIVDAAVRYSNLVSGTIDMVTTLDPNQMNQLSNQPGYSLLEPVSSNKTVLAEVAIKNNKAFKDQRVMHALIHSLDKEAILKNVYQGFGKILWSPFPSNNFAYQPGTEYEYDIDKAKKLLEEAGYDEGLTFTLILPTGSPDLEQIAVIWQSGLEKAGVQMEIEKMELNSWVAKYVERSYEMTLNFYPQAGSDPSIYANQILLPLVQNGLEDPSQWEELIARGATTADVGEREAIYKEIQEMVSEQAPIIPIQEMPISAGISDKLTNVEIYPTNAIFFGNAQVK